MSLRLTVLGSGTIIPSIDRRATALMVEAGGEPYLFDCGPGVLEAMEELGFSFRSLYNIFLTHYHPDHTLGLGRLLAAINNDTISIVRERLAIHGPSGLKDFLESWNNLYSSTLPKRDYLELDEIGSGDVSREGLVRIRAAEAKHGDIPALAYRIDEENTSIVYTGDSEYSETLVELSAGAGVLVAECSFPDERPVPGHMTPSDVGRLASDAGVEQVLLVHMYPEVDGTDPARSVKKRYKGRVTVARDGMVLDLGVDESGQK